MSHMPPVPDKPKPQQPTHPLLANANKGRKKTAQFILVFGPPGAGKSSWAALAPNPLFLDLDGGSSHLDVTRLEGLELHQVIDLISKPELLHGYDTIVVDSVKELEEMMISDILNRTGKTSMSDFQWGAGFIMLYEKWKMMANLMKSLAKQGGKNVVLVAHDALSPVINANANNYLRIEPAIHHPKPTDKEGEKPQSPRKYVMSQADHVLPILHEVLVDGNNKPFGTGKRIMWTVDQAAFCAAKSRGLRESYEVIEGDRTIWDLLMNLEEQTHAAA